MYRFEACVQDIDAMNGLDPHMEIWQDKKVPKELLYSLRMTEMLDNFLPDASEELRLAARAQHIQRWTIPREKYPMDRKGYLQWRTELKKFHGQLATDIMKKHGYSEEEMKRVDDLINKRRLKTDPETQALEDVICLVFLQYYFDEFANKHIQDEEKIVDIVQKTWRKMSEKGHQAALNLPHSEQTLRLVKKALA